MALLIAGMTWRGTGWTEGLFLLPSATLALALATLLHLGRAHATGGEVLAAWTFASAALPTAIIGGAPPGHAMACTAILAAIQTLGTLCVRATLTAARLRNQGLRYGPLLLGALLIGLGWINGRSWREFAALAPVTAVAAAMAGLAPGPRHLKRLGWSLAAATASGLWILLG